jgi:hypothetical protein
MEGHNWFLNQLVEIPRWSFIQLTADIHFLLEDEAQGHKIVATFSSLSRYQWMHNALPSTLVPPLQVSEWHITENRQSQLYDSVPMSARNICTINNLYFIFLYAVSNTWTVIEPTAVAVYGFLYQQFAKTKSKSSFLFCLDWSLQMANNSWTI